LKGRAKLVPALRAEKYLLRASFKPSGSRHKLKLESLNSKPTHLVSTASLPKCPKVGYVIKNFLCDKLQFVDKLKLIEQQTLLGITNKFLQD
jgi:hypothetical protein